MIVAHRRFTPVQRLLHWLMAACILAVLFIGVGHGVHGDAEISDARRNP